MAQSSNEWTLLLLIWLQCGTYPTVQQSYLISTYTISGAKYLCTLILSAVHQYSVVVPEYIQLIKHDVLFKINLPSSL